MRQGFLTPGGLSGSRKIELADSWTLGLADSRTLGLTESFRHSKVFAFTYKS